METATALKEADAATRDVDGMTVNVAVGYGGRREVVDAVRSCSPNMPGAGRPWTIWRRSCKPEHIAEHLYTRGQPDPDLVIRTSGEQRLSGFAVAERPFEFYFCEAYWPDFRRVDFLRAMRAYADRQRRFGN